MFGSKKFQWIRNFLESSYIKLVGNQEQLDEKITEIDSKLLEIDAKLNAFIKKFLEVQESQFTSIEYLSHSVEDYSNQIIQLRKDILENLSYRHQDLENINALTRRAIHDINAGFFNEECKQKRQFGNVHNTYDDEFYRQNRYNSHCSGLRVLMPIMRALQPESVVDFGCGTGTWLYAAQKYHVRVVKGLDGCYVPPDMLLIDEACFEAVDLRNSVTLDMRYDMAISVEVAEHLPDTSADVFVGSICAASDIVVFSAAHANQGGDDHINEQPIEYWIEKFHAHGYRHIEIRPYYQGDWEIESWYRENLGMYVRENRLDEVVARLKTVWKM